MVQKILDRFKSFFFKPEPVRPSFVAMPWNEIEEDETPKESNLPFALWAWFSDRVAEGVLSYDHFEDFEDIFGGECFSAWTLDEFLNEYHL